MAYKPNYATGDLVTTAIWQELVNRAIYIFANPSARDNASTGITSPTEGQFCYLLDITGSGGGGSAPHIPLRQAGSGGSGIVLIAYDT